MSIILSIFVAIICIIGMLGYFTDIDKSYFTGLLGTLCGWWMPSPHARQDKEKSIEKQVD
jgi:hypothetical protein